MSYSGSLNEAISRTRVFFNIYVYVVYNYISSYQNILLGIVLLFRTKIQILLLEKL